MKTISFKFSEKDLNDISKVLGEPAKPIGNGFRYEINHHNPERKLTLEIYPDMKMGDDHGVLVSVYTVNSHLQLQYCTGFVLSEVLEEVTFVAESGRKVSGLIIEKVGGCSMFSNVDRSVLSGNFSQMGPEIMMSSVALSLTEHILQNPPDEDADKG